MTRLSLLALLAACGPSPGTTSTTPDEGSSEPVEEGEASAPAEDPRIEEPPPPAAREDSVKKGDEPAAGPPILAAHNRFRARHCAPPLTWSTKLVAEARRWAKNLAAQRCAFEHNPDPRFGENLAYFRPPGALSEEQIAAHWYKEIERYNFKRPGFSMEAGHFTQLVWVGSRHLGCASIECGGGELWVCNYDPPGNMQGDFDRNVRREGCK